MRRISKLKNFLKLGVDSNMLKLTDDQIDLPVCDARRLAMARSKIREFDRIDSLQQMNDLEKKLQKSVYKQHLIHRMSHICGESGNMIGLNCSYLLADHFFTRRFITECSWAGGSRSGGEKIAFMKYENIINLFQTLVQKADKSFSMIHCHKFLKKIISNSRTRNVSGPIAKISTSRCKKQRKVSAPNENRRRRSNSVEIVSVEEVLIQTETNPCPMDYDDDDIEV